VILDFLRFGDFIASTPSPQTSLAPLCNFLLLLGDLSGDRDGDDTHNGLCDSIKPELSARIGDPSGDATLSPT